MSILTTKKSLLLCAIGLGTALLPVTVYILSGTGSPVQRMLNAVIAGTQPTLLMAIFGTLVAAVGMHEFVRTMRQPPPRPLFSWIPLLRAMRES